MESTLGVILAGGIGSRLHPLTNDRTKPAVPFGGKFRIIDFTLNNCLHSGIRRILVLTQYKSHSLQKHLRDGWSIFNPELGEYVTTVPPQMRTGERWYSGTADAIFQNIYLLERSKAKWVVILSGDHIYRMDYKPMVEFHRQSGGDLTVASMQVSADEAKNFGVLTYDDNMQVESFIEKPKNPIPETGEQNTAHASMGVYVFSMDILLNVLQTDHLESNSSHDFGKDIIPKLIKSHRVFGYQFGGEAGRVSQDRYWRDVGNIDTYFEANMDLLKPIPPLNLYQENWQIRTYTGQYPPARTAPGFSGNEGIFINSIVASGTVISGGSVQNSILFSQVNVDDEAQVYNSIIFDNVQIGKGTNIRNCIIDKDVIIPANEHIGYDAEIDAKRFFISPGGIVVIPKGYQFSENE